MNPVLHGIEVPQAEIERFCARKNIRKLSLFGSILAERFRPDSDVDVLVEFETAQPLLTWISREWNKNCLP